MGDQCLHAFAKSHGMRQLGVFLEGLLILPLRVNVEQATVADRTERVNTDAAWLVPRRSKHLLESFGCLRFLPLERMKLCKDVDFHSPPARSFALSFRAVRGVYVKSNYYNML